MRIDAEEDRTRVVKLSQPGKFVAISLLLAGLTVVPIASRKPLGADSSAEQQQGRTEAMPKGSRHGEPQYLFFWSDADTVAQLGTRLGTVGDGESRFLGFGISSPTFDMENKLPQRIRDAFQGAIKHGIAVHFHFDFHLAWKSRGDLWNWFDPAQPGFNPGNRANVEWSDWKGTPSKARYLDWGTPERIAPHMCYTSQAVRKEITRIVEMVIAPVVRSEIDSLRRQGKERLFAGITVGSEPAIDDYSSPDERTARLMEADGTPRARLGYCALSSLGYSKSKPPEDFRRALAEVNREFVEFWAKQFVDAGLPSSRLYTHIPAPAPQEQINAPIWTAFNRYSRPGWTTYPIGPLASDFEVIYRELARHGDPPWGGVEANAGFARPGVDWEEYLRRHFEHGAAVVGINTGATSETLTNQLTNSALGPDALAAYKKFLSGGLASDRAKEPGGPGGVAAEEAPGRIQQKMQQVQKEVQLWHEDGRDVSPVETIMREAQSLLGEGKLRDAEARVDRALALIREQTGARLAKGATEGGSTAKAAAAPPSAVRQDVSLPDPQYLVFQLFTYLLDGSRAFDKKKLNSTVKEIVESLKGLRGDGKNRQLGFAVGPLSLDQTDEELREIIRESFKLAEDMSVAVAFHIDDSMFWLRRSDLWRDSRNVEWMDWKGTVYPRRYVDWVIGPTLAPQMCYTSPTLRKEITRIAKEVIGAEIRRGVESLKARGKGQLFAGVIAGWETHLADYSTYGSQAPPLLKQMDLDGSPRVRIGYCALSNLGFGPGKLPPDFAAALERVVHEWASFWVTELRSAGIPVDRLYTHFALSDWKAFNSSSRPGFSIYTSAQFERVYSELAKHGNPRWALAEGTNLDQEMLGVSWEAYLGSLFDHGATLATIFAWHEKDRTIYGRATTSKQAIAAYEKFLRGEPLADSTELTPFQAKVRRVRQKVPAFIRRTGDPAQISSLIERMQQYVNEQKLREAEGIADEILRLIEAK